MRRRKTSSYMLLAIAIILAVILIVLFALAQGALARSDETIERIDQKIEAVMDR